MKRYRNNRNRNNDSPQSSRNAHTDTFSQSSGPAYMRRLRVEVVDLLRNKTANQDIQIAAMVSVGLNVTRFFKNKILSDFQIICENKTIPVHKIVLAAGSPVFNRMLQTDCNESKECKLTIVDFTHETVMEMVMFMYTGGTANINDIVALDLLKIAEKYELMRLKSLCENVIISTISVATVIDLFNIADNYNAAELEKAAIRFIKSRFNEIQRNGAYRSLPQHLLVKLCDAALGGSPTKRMV